MKLKALMMLFALVCCLTSCKTNTHTAASSQTAQNESSEMTSFETNSVLANELVAALKEKKATNLSFYYVKETTANFSGYKPLNDFKRYGKLKSFKELTALKDIENFRNSLDIDSWQEKMPSKRAFPELIVYFGTDIHINLEGNWQGNCYISINSSEGRAFYLVSEQVYEYVLSFYSK